MQCVLDYRYLQFIGVSCGHHAGLRLQIFCRAVGINHAYNCCSHLWLGRPVYPVLDLLGCPFLLKEALFCQDAQEDTTLVHAEF